MIREALKTFGDSRSRMFREVRKNLSQELTDIKEHVMVLENENSILRDRVKELEVHMAYNEAESTTRARFESECG
jgi:regulator of replication initiation timing